MLFQIEVRHMLQYHWLLKSHTTLLQDIYDVFSDDCLRWESRSQWQLRCLVCDKKWWAGWNDVDVVILIQIVVRQLLQYVWILKSPSTLLPDIYNGVPADWLRWECRSRWQLRCLVYDKRKLARLIQFPVLVILQIVVRQMLQYVWILKSPSTLLPNIYDGFSADWIRWKCRSHWQLHCLVY